MARSCSARRASIALMRRRRSAMLFSRSSMVFTAGHPLAEEVLRLVAPPRTGLAYVGIFSALPNSGSQTGLEAPRCQEEAPLGLQTRCPHRPGAGTARRSFGDKAGFPGRYRLRPQTWGRGDATYAIGCCRL